jgi:glycosyltransferase involved in cell wall biosynthesis
MDKSNTFQIKVAHIEAVRIGPPAYPNMYEKDWGTSYKYYLTNLCEEQAKMGLRSTAYFCSRDGKSEIIEHREGYDMKFLPAGIQLPKFLKRIYPYPISLKLIRQVMKDEPDIIHYHGCFNYYLMFFLFVLAAKPKKIKIIGNIHGDSVRPPIKAFPIYLINLISCRLADKFITETEAVKIELVKDGFISEKKADVVANGVNLEVFRPMNKNECREALGLDNDTKYLLWVSRLSCPQKDPFTVMRVVKDIDKNLKFIILGTGEDYEFEKLKQYARKLGITKKVIIANKQGWEITRMYYNASDVYILHTKSTGLHQTNIEAMACKTPVIASNMIGNREVIEDDGILVPFQNKQKIKDAILKLIEDDKLREDLATRGYEKVKNNYSWEKINKKIVAVYYSLPILS